MEDAADMRAAMKRLGCSQGVVRAIVNEHGIDSLDKLKALKDDDITALCEDIRRPIGTIPNPNAGEEGQPKEIPIVGHAIPYWVEENLKLAAYFAFHMIDRISRPFAIADLSVGTIRTVIKIRDDEKNYSKPDVKPILDDENWTLTIAEIGEYFARIRGKDGLPLSYIVRKNRDVMDERFDSPEKYEKNPLREMAYRAPHYASEPNTYTEAYEANNAMVAEELIDILLDHPAYACVMAFLTAGDGRRAFFALKNYQSTVSREDATKVRDLMRVTATRNIPEVSARPTTNGVEDRYYSAAEYKMLTDGQREELRQKRAKRGHIPGSKSSKVQPQKKRKLNRQVATRPTHSDVTGGLAAQNEDPNAVSTDTSTLINRQMKHE